MHYLPDHEFWLSYALTFGNDMTLMIDAWLMTQENTRLEVTTWPKASTGILDI